MIEFNIKIKPNDARFKDAQKFARELHEKQQYRLLHKSPSGELIDITYDPKYKDLVSELRAAGINIQTKDCE